MVRGRDARIAKWIEDMREFAVHLMGSTGLEKISVNDLFQAIMDNRCPAPPSNAGLLKRGSILSSVFSGVPYFYDTGEMVAGANPESKKRKVKVWGLNRAAMPIMSSRAKMVLSDCGDWA